MSYLRGLYLDSFQTTKRRSYDGYSIYKAIFNSFHEVVYPVGVTTNRSSFMQIIRHNSRTIHQICTNVDAKIRLWTPFLCAKFQGNWSTCLHFIAIVASVQKHKEKKKKKKSKFWQLVSQKWLKRFLSNLVCKLPWLAGSSVVRNHRDTSVKMTFSFFLSIYPWCGALASWATRHTIVCLDDGLLTYYYFLFSM